MTTETVAEKFWRESRELKAYRENLARLRGLERFDAVLEHEWTAAPGLRTALYEPIHWGPQDLDEWLAEDNPYRGLGVLEALGLD